MKTDPTHYKPHLRSYLTAHGVRTEADRFECTNPEHSDTHPSAYIYDESRLYCPVCEATYDIFDCAGHLTGSTLFPDQLADVQRVIDGSVPTDKPKSKPKPTPDNYKPVPVPYDQAKQVFTRKDVESLGSLIVKKDDMHLGKVWPYLNIDGEIVLIDARFEYTRNGQPDKDVITMYYNGKGLRAKSPPCLLYGLQHLPDADAILFHEGCKSADAGRELIPEWAHLTWNGGGKKSHKVDLSPLSGVTVPVYLLPDDDDPGRQAMAVLRNRLRDELGIDAKIIPPLESAREIKSKGADIVEWTQVADREEIVYHVINSDPLSDFQTTVHSASSPELAQSPEGGVGATPHRTDSDSSPESSPPSFSTPEPPPTFTHPGGLPYRPLGIDAQGMANFIGVADRFVRYQPAQLTRGALKTIAPLTWWSSEFPGGKGTVDWEAAIDEVVQFSMSADFDPEITRGRGAWRERSSGQTVYVYHDGKHTSSTGTLSGQHLYIRRPRSDIGIASPECHGDTRREIFDAAAGMSWATKADCVRIMSWAALSPFCGALPWRPAGLLTGDSGSGKSTVVDYVVRPIACPLFLSGGESTEAGIRQTTEIDARNVVLEESEADTDKKAHNREAIFSLMRQSTTDDTPKVVKGSTSGKAMTFTMRNMFLFIAIDPEINAVADENRTFRAHMKKPSGEWYPIRDRLQALLKDSPDNCAGIRAYTWRMLPEIVGMVDWLAEIIADATGRDIRWSTAEAMLMAAYFVVWRDRVPTKEQAREAVNRFYESSPPETKRDQTDETIQALLDETVMVSGMRGTTYTLRGILSVLSSGRIESDSDADYDGYRDLTKDEKRRFKNTLGQYGLSVMRDGNVAIADNHKAVKRIIRAGDGYHFKLKRHRAAIDHKPVMIDGTTRWAVVFTPEIVDNDEPPF